MNAETPSAEERRQLADSPLFERLEPDALEFALDAVRARVCEAGQAIVREGDEADEFYLLLDGEVVVEAALDGSEPIRLTDLTAGAWFGEVGLLEGGRRTATVRALKRTRYAVIPGEVFLATHSRDAVNRASFAASAAEYARNRVVRSLQALRGLSLDELAGSTRLSLPRGESIVRQGEAGDAVYFILEGSAVAVREEDDRQVFLSRLGSGQCVGELAVLEGGGRRASVVAETDVDLLRVEAESFRQWAEDHAPLRDMLSTLYTVYDLEDGSNLSVFNGEVDGYPAVSTLRGDPAGDCVISTKLRDQEVFLLTRGGIEPGDSETLKYESEGSGSTRELTLEVLERNERGVAQRAQVIGVVAHGDGPDLQGLYRRVLGATEVRRKELVSFRRFGYLGGTEDMADSSRVCRCLRISAAMIEEVAAKHGATLAAVSRATGCSSVCGSCRDGVEALLARLGGEPLPDDPARQDSPTAAQGRQGDEFGPRVEARVEAYLQEHGLDPQSSRRTAIGCAFLWALLLLCYVALLRSGSAVWLIGIALASAGVIMASLHDAGHNAFSSNRLVNELVYLGAELHLISRRWWRTKHGWHHRWTGSVPFDDDLDKVPLFRLSPGQDWKPHYRYQWLYAWLFYPLVHLAMINSGIRYLLQGKVGKQQFEPPPAETAASDLALIVFGAALWLILPSLFFSPLAVLAGAVCVSLGIGIILSLVFQVEHCVTGVRHPPPGTEPDPRAMATTTANVSLRNPLLTWYTGGLNHHIEHHLFPDLNHGHLHAIQPIVQQTCEEFDVPYRLYDNMGQALGAHRIWLNEMGRKPAGS